MYFAYVINLWNVLKFAWFAIIKECIYNDDIHLNNNDIYLKKNNNNNCNDVNNNNNNASVIRNECLK